MKEKNQTWHLFNHSEPMQHTREQQRPYEVKADGLHYGCAQAF